MIVTTSYQIGPIIGSQLALAPIPTHIQQEMSSSALNGDTIVPKWIFWTIIWKYSYFGIISSPGISGLKFVDK